MGNRRPVGVGNSQFHFQFGEFSRQLLQPHRHVQMRIGAVAETDFPVDRAHHDIFGSGVHHVDNKELPLISVRLFLIRKSLSMILSFLLPRSVVVLLPIKISAFCCELFPHLPRLGQAFPAHCRQNVENPFKCCIVSHPQRAPSTKTKIWLRWGCRRRRSAKSAAVLPNRPCGCRAAKEVSLWVP